MGRKLYVRPPQKKIQKVDLKQSGVARRRWETFRRARAMGLDVSNSTPVATMEAKIREKEERDRKKLARKVAPPPVHVIDPPIVLKKEDPGPAEKLAPNLYDVLKTDYTTEQLDRINRITQMEIDAKKEREHEEELKQPLTVTFSPGCFTRWGTAFGRAMGLSLGMGIAESLRDEGMAGPRPGRPAPSAGPG